MYVHAYRWQFTPTPTEVEQVIDKFGTMDIPDNFVATVSPYSQGAKVKHGAGEFVRSTM